MEERILVLFDTHVPHQINLEPVWEFAKDFKPTQVVLGGDVHEWSSVSSWLADQSKLLEGGTIAASYEELEHVIFKPIRKAAPKAKKVFIVGNHDDRINTVLRVQPNFRGFIELSKNIPKDFEIVPVNMPYCIGSNLIVIHGLYTNAFHAKKTVEAYHVSVLYGHVHTFQSYTLISPIDPKKFYMGQSIGCLSTLNPEFMKNRPNSWMNGFCYVYVNSDETFHHVPVIIVDGKFYAEGRKYK